MTGKALLPSGTSRADSMDKQMRCRLFDAPSAATKSLVNSAKLWTSGLRAGGRDCAKGVSSSAGAQ